ncbi:MAG: hypothetical protein KatS3mg068_0221 [Candidatus Sericytochromatia bacterium]|nr:MAG: hypothetical protein KatS3mg068_0221 [Candidatus Sericytochromatia bacterium]
MNLLNVLKEKYINNAHFLSKEDFCNIYKYPFLIGFENNKNEFLDTKSPTIIGKTLEEIEEDYNKSVKISLIFPVIKRNKNPFLKKITIGRSSLQDISIQDMTVSKFHAYFYNDENKYYLVDNNSTNGTFVNNVRIEPDKSILINDKDIMMFSTLKFIFYLPETAYEIFKIQ